MAKYEEIFPDRIVSQCGLIIHGTMKFVAATPDRFVHDPTFDPADGIMEVKCPVATMERPEVAAVTKKGFYLQSGNGKVSLNREHAYYYQVMCQMSCSGCSWCDFVVMCGGEFFVERIHYDAKFWADCVPKLRGFYMEYLLPELTCPGQ